VSIKRKRDMRKRKQNDISLYFQGESGFDDVRGLEEGQDGGGAFKL
jgi:hypothetical protein